MNGLLQQLWENFTFVLVCLLVIFALAVLARFSEQFFPEKRKVSTARYVSIVGICAAIATVLHILDFPILVLAPEFYKLDFSELPVLLCGFYLGPTATVACEGVKILLKLVVKGTSTAFVGDFANFVVGCSFVLPATIWYHLHKSRHSAIIGMGSAIRSGVNSVTTFVMLCVAPLNLLKGTMVSMLTMLLYKRVARPLFGIHK